MAESAAAQLRYKSGASAGDQGEAVAGRPAESSGERHPQPGLTAGEAAG